jgi:hypothetical protein
MYYECENVVSFLKSYVIYIFISLFVTFSTILVVGKLISSTEFALILALFLAIILISIKYILEKHEKSVDRLIEVAWGDKKIFILVSVASIVAGIFLHVS